MFVAQGETDTVIPRELLDRTWRYLHADSGAPTQGRRDPGGHGITAATLHRLGEWVAERLSFLAAHAAAPVGSPGDVAWPTLPDAVLPHRAGPSPDVSWDIPQQQLSQNAPVALQESAVRARQRAPRRPRWRSRASRCPGRGPSPSPTATGPTTRSSCPRPGEFAHLHPGYDGSLHLALPPAQAADLVAHGWGVPHPWAGTRLSAGFVMLFGPRDEDELEVVTGVVAAAHAYASGASSQPQHHSY